MISIIIPVYKVEKYIRKCLDSVRNQTYSDIEIIVVDDGSPDSCPQICDEYASKDNRITVIHQINQGLSGARNTGLKRATGDYILFLDSDDYLDHDYCEVLYQELVKNGSDIAIGEIITEDEDGHRLIDSQQLFFDETHTLDRTTSLKQMVVEEELKGFAWGKLMKREITDGIQFPVGKLYEDRYTVPKYFFRSDKIVLCKGAATHYVLRNASITHGNVGRLFDLIEGEKWLLDYCEQNYKELIPIIVEKYFGRLVHVWIEMYDKGSDEQIEKMEMIMHEAYDNYSGMNVKMAHKISYKMIFICPKIYRMLIKAAGKE